MGGIYFTMDYNDFVSTVKTLAEHIGLDFSAINRIHVAIYESLTAWKGKVDTVNINGKLCFEIFFQQHVIYDYDYDLDSDNTDKKLLAKSIILHELFHCKEMLTTSLCTDWENLYFHKPINTTRLWLFDSAIHMWGEYYAYFNSSKYYERNVNLIDVLSTSNAELKVLHNEFSKTPVIDNIQIPTSFMRHIDAFIHRCIMLVAYYNSTHKRKYLKEFKHIENSPIYQNYHPYLKDLSHYMDFLYITYPNWISESAFVELGRKLFSFIRINSLTYYTTDLSDNFILTKTDI